MWTLLLTLLPRAKKACSALALETVDRTGLSIKEV